MAQFSPSSFPGLFKCRKYISSGKYSPAAARGKVLHTVLENLLNFGIEENSFDLSMLSDKDKKNVLWSYYRITELIEQFDSGHEMVTEEYIKGEVNGEKIRGQIDVHVGPIIFDYKSGLVNFYKPQMLVYAKLLFDKDDYNTIGLVEVYGAEKKIVKYTVTREEAIGFVDRLVDEVRDPDAQPTSCEYCKWCKHNTTCPVAFSDQNKDLQVQN